jgi:hypothetical protein
MPTPRLARGDARFEWSRRRFLGFVGPMVAVGPLIASGVLAFPGRRLFAGDEAPPEPHWSETPADDEGPFYREGAPKRADLRVAGAPAPAITVSGVVRAEDGKVLPGVRLDVWHADAAGNYDNDTPAYRYRGVLTTDANGRYRLDTNYPGRYGVGRARRPRHIHVKLSGAGLYALTTQTYYEVRPNVDAPEELVVPIAWTGEGKERTGTGTWNPVLSRVPPETK